MDFERFVIESLKEIKENQEKTLVQTTKTNGRVTALEKLVEEHDETIQGLFEKQSIKRGQENVMWKVAAAVGSVGTVVLAWVLGRHH